MGNSRFVPSIISTSCAWQESAIGNFCDELPDNVWMSDSIAIDLDFESLDRPSWTVFDLLVKRIIVLSRVTAFP